MTRTPFFRILLSVLLFALCVRGAEKTEDVTKSGVIGDGTTLNTAALQKAIDACSASGGGVLTFPSGRYLIGTIQLKDNVRLHLEAEAVLLGSTNAADYRNLDPFIDGTGRELGYALIISVEAKGVGIEGPGAIDGQGPALKATQETYTIRPFLTRWVRCSDVTLKEVTLRNPGAWTNHFFQCKNVAVERVTIRSHIKGIPNNDGIDIDSCEGVKISDCDIESGDDSICFKATSPQPNRDHSVTNCKLSTACNAIKFGTESIGDFERIKISNCQLTNVGMSGIALYSVDGAHLHEVTVDGITMSGVMVPISVRLGARLKTFRPGDTAKTPGTLRHVTIKNVRATGVKRIGVLMNGIPGHPVEAITLENVEIELPGGGAAENAAVQLAEKEKSYPEYKMFGEVMPAYGFYVRHVRGVTFKNVRTTLAKPDARPEKVFIDVEGVTPADFAPAPL